MQLRIVFHTLLGVALMLIAACQHTSENPPAMPGPKGPFTARAPKGTPKSVYFFSDAEQKLAIKEYTFAAAQLNKGIIAYRVETGKMCCEPARQANKAIDMLIQFRQKLRQGKPVLPHELRMAIQQALDVEDAGALATPQKTDESIAVPVGN